MGNTVITTIECDTPKGYEPVAFRVPKLGETFVTDFGKVLTGTGNGHRWRKPRLIVRKTWTPPSWLPEGSYLYSNFGVWRCSPVEPQSVGFGGGFARVLSSPSFCVSQWAQHGYDFTPPPVECIKIHHED